jgi:hypothetical protein
MRPCSCTRVSETVVRVSLYQSFTAIDCLSCFSPFTSASFYSAPHIYIAPLVAQPLLLHISHSPAAKQPPSAAGAPGDLANWHCRFCSWLSCGSLRAQLGLRKPWAISRE